MIGYTFNLCFVHSRRHSSSTYLPQPFHLLPTHRTLSLTSLLLFIRPRTNQHPQLRSKALYIILGSYPYNNNNNNNNNNNKRKKMNQTTLVNQAT